MSKCYASSVIKIALNEVGYLEKASNSNLDSFTENAGAANYTKYARDIDTYYPSFYGGKINGQSWCDVFVDWCFIKAYGEAGAKKLLCQPSYSAGANVGESADYFIKANRLYKDNPKPGDQIFITYDGTSRDHTGLVVDVDSSYVYTVEGNSSNAVRKHTYPLNDSSIYGYGRPDYDEAGETEPEDPDVITYIVQEGDTLNDIAARYGTTAQAIADYNGISDVNLIYVGQVLYIPTGSSQSYTTYIVKSGDSLGRIAVSYGLTVAEVATFNSISDPDTIYVGQEIKIPVSGRRDYIRMFQQAVCDAGVAQITVDGIWGNETASVAVYAEVEKGTMGPLATFAQTMLVAYGYSLPNSGIDGDFWTESVNATIQYQQDHGLVADGIIGIATWKDMLQVN